MDHRNSKRWKNDTYFYNEYGDNGKYTQEFYENCNDKIYSYPRYTDYDRRSYSPNDDPYQQQCLSRSRYGEKKRHKHKHKKIDKEEDKAESNAIQRRKKPFKFWDVAPRGYEHLTPQQYKALQASGQIPINVYAAGQVPMPDDAPNAPLVLHSDIPFAGSAVCRQARRLYVGNIPFVITEPALADFFNSEMKVKNLIHSQDEGQPVIAVQINTDKNFAFVEFRSVDETTQALALDGTIFHGQQLKLRRPRDYVPLPGFSDNPSIALPGLISTMVQETPNKIFVGSLPTYLSDDQVKELLLSFGHLKGFNLVKDPSTGLSKGYAFCEYTDSSITDVACQKLNGIQLGDKKIIVQRASIGAKSHSLLPTPGGSSQIGSSRVMCLLNLIEEADLIDDEEYEDILDDVRTECCKYGPVMSLEIPRPNSSLSKSATGVGKVFVEFATVEDCQRAVVALTGRKFNNRMVITSYFDHERYNRRDFA